VSSTTFEFETRDAVDDVDGVYGLQKYSKWILHYCNKTETSFECHSFVMTIFNFKLLLYINMFYKNEKYIPWCESLQFGP
jgi:hypothetical protein